MKSFKQLISEMMTSAGGGIAGMHQSVTPMDSLPEVGGREADRLAIRSRRKKKKKDKIEEAPLHDLMNKHDDPLEFAKAASSAVKKKELNLKPRGAANTRELVALWYKKRMRDKMHPADKNFAQGSKAAKDSAQSYKEKRIARRLEKGNDK